MKRVMQAVWSLLYLSWCCLILHAFSDSFPHDSFVPNFLFYLFYDTWTLFSQTLLIFCFMLWFWTGWTNRSGKGLVVKSNLMLNSTCMHLLMCSLARSFSASTEKKEQTGSVNRSKSPSRAGRAASVGAWKHWLLVKDLARHATSCREDKGRAYVQSSTSSLTLSECSSMHVPRLY